MHGNSLGLEKCLEARAKSAMTRKCLDVRQGWKMHDIPSGLEKAKEFNRARDCMEARVKSARRKVTRSSSRLIEARNSQKTTTPDYENNCHL